MRQTYPQHTRRIIRDESDEGRLFTYCTVCAWDSDDLRAWAIHLDFVAAFHDDADTEHETERSQTEIAKDLGLIGDQYAATELDAKGHPV